jgi:murein DD-endopeptidase MepM/ murein hydrolase activator NlpD
MSGHRRVRLLLAAAFAGTLLAGAGTAAATTPEPLGDDFGVVLEPAPSAERVAAAEAAAAADEQAGARPVLRVPFRCGQIWRAESRADHSPSRWSVDFNRGSGSDDLGLPVKTSGAGTVTISTSAGGYGNYIEIAHGNGWRTRYAHLMSRGVSVGDHVGPGARIGRVGATGDVTGSHLHYEQRKDGVVVRPRFGAGTWFNYPGPQYLARSHDC